MENDSKEKVFKHYCQLRNHKKQNLDFQFDFKYISILKQYASRFMLIFIKILKMYLKVNNCEVIKEETGTYTKHDYNKAVKICKNSCFCISRTVEKICR
jgi:hypothetical protein